MKYPIHTSAIIDVTKPPYCADNTGRTDCTAILRQILDDILIRQVEALQATHDKLIALSNDMQEDVYIGMEGGRVQDGKLSLTFPEYEPSNKIIYFPKGRYLVSDTVTYTLENLKQYWYWVTNYENNRNIHFLGESKEETVICLADHAKGYEAGNTKPLISFTNNELALPRNQEFTNVAFMNTIEDITLDCGTGNDGAVGIKYVSSNCGRIENVEIRATKGNCGIYVANNTSQAVFSDIIVRGFDYGIDMENSALIAIDQLDVSETAVAGIHTGASTLFCDRVRYGNIPAVKFKDTAGKGRYYFTDPTISLANDALGNTVYFEHDPSPLRSERIPHNTRSEEPADWVCVDDFGAVGDGVTDCTRAIQKAMQSGKPIVVFGEGEYLINAKIKIPKTVKTVDFLFCSLACGTRLVGGEYDAAFEVSETSDDLLFIENLSAWENFKGHMRLIKHAARRDLVLSDLHLMSASMYFNSVTGSHVFLDNCFLTTGTYTRTAWLPGKGFTPAYCHILPFEFHGQTVYGRMINPERADVAMVNDASAILLDTFRTEGPGTMLKSMNGGMTKVNISNAGGGYKQAENPLFEAQDAQLDLTGCIAFGWDQGTEYNCIIKEVKDGNATLLNWEDLDSRRSPHCKILHRYVSE